MVLLQSGWPLVRCIPLGRDIMWQSVTTSVRLTFGQMYPHRWSFGLGWHLIRLWVRLTFGEMYHLPRQTSCGEVYYYFGSDWHFVRSSVQVDLWSDVPPTDEALGQIDIWSDFGSGWPLVRCTPLPGRPPVVKCITNLGQVDILSDLQFRLTFGQM